MEAIITEPSAAPSSRSRTSTVTPAVHGRIPSEEINAVNGFTPRVQRLKQRYLEARSTIDGERAWWLVESLKQTEGEHPAKRRAKAFSNVLDTMTIVIREDELLVGAMTRFLRGALPSVDTNPKALKAIMQQAEPQ